MRGVTSYREVVRGFGLILHGNARTLFSYNLRPLIVYSAFHKMPGEW
jgi:hypothetical protein